MSTAVSHAVQLLQTVIVGAGVALASTVGGVTVGRAEGFEVDGSAEGMTQCCCRCIVTVVHEVH
jgi:hypothetical protein